MERGGRKPTPVQVIFFPKKARRARLTQTIPEIAGPIDEPVTEVDIEPPLDERKAAKDKRRRTKSGSHARVTLSDEKPADVVAGLSELAALGHELFSLGRVQEARAIFEGLVASSPRDAFPHTMLGTICLALEEHDRALELFEAALRIDPDDLAALVYRGELKLNRKRLKAATEDLERAVEVGAEDDPFVDRARRLLKMARARK